MRSQLALALLSLAACGGEDPLLIVDLKTDLVPGTEFDHVRVDVTDSTGAGTRFAEIDTAADDDFSSGQRVAELEGLEAGTLTLRVTLSRDGSEVLQRPVRVSLDGRLAVTVVMTRACVGVVCPAMDGDPIASACLAGRCVNPDCVEDDAACGEPECATDADCVAEASCGVGRCEVGTCLYDGNAGTCPSGTFCDERRGCTAPEWPAFRSALEDAAAMGSTGEPTARTLGAGLSSGGGKWVGGVLGADGRVYGIPFSSAQVLVLDPVTEEISFFGDMPGGEKFIGGVLGPDGIIYACPARAEQFLAIDPEAQTLELFGPTIDPAVDVAFGGSVLSLDGRVVCVPAGETRVAVIDLTDRSVDFFGALPSAGQKFRGGVVTPSGVVVAIPAEDGTGVLRVDLTTNSVDVFGSVTPVGRDWYGGAITPSGLVIGLPSGSTTLLRIDAGRSVVEVLPSDGTGVSTSGRAGAIAPNGHVYVMPNSGPILEIDLATFATRDIPAPPSPDAAWIGAVLAPNGRIYGIPYEASDILEIDPHSVGSFPLEVLTSPFLDKL